MNAMLSPSRPFRRATPWIALLLAFACGRRETPAPPGAPAATKGTPVAASAAPPAAKPAPDDVEDGHPAPPLTNDVFTLEPTLLDLGLIDPNEIRKVDFKIRNDSKQPFKILSVRTGCHCVTLEYPKIAIASGASSLIHLKVMGAIGGKKRIPVTIWADDPKHSVAEVLVGYAIIPDVVCVPPTLDFGKVRIGEVAEQSMKVTLHLPPEVEKDPVLEPFITHDLGIKLTLDPPTVKPTALGHRDITTTLHAVLDTSRPQPSFRSELVFKPKGEKTFRLTTIMVLGEVRGVSWFEHDKLVFTGTAVGTPVTKSVRFYYAGEQAPTFADVAVGPAGFSEKHEVEADHHCVRFDVTCAPPADGPLNGELRVKAGDATFTVALTARGK